MKYIKTFEQLNEGLLPGKSKENIKEIFKNMSHSDIFYKVDGMFTTQELNDRTLHNMNKLKSITYDNVFIFEIVSSTWDDSFNLDAYGVCDINSNVIIDKIYKSLIKTSIDYFDDKEDLDEHKELIRTTMEHIDDDTTVDDIIELLSESDQLLNVYYKVGGIVYTLDYSDKLLKYVK